MGAMDAAGEAFVRVVRLDDLGPEVEKRLGAVLDGPERDVLASRRRPEDRRAYAAAHGLLRFALSELLGGEPEVWRFDAPHGGKPLVVEPETSGIDFSISHTAGWIACAVARGARVGVDVEAVGPAAVARELAPRVLSPGERAGLEGLEDDAIAARFFALWTLKESYVKVTGEGMSAPLTEVTYDPDGTGRLVASPALESARCAVYGASLGGDAATHRWAVTAAPMGASVSRPVLHLLGGALPPV